MIMNVANEKWRLTKAELMRTSVRLGSLQSRSLELPFSRWLLHISRCPRCQKCTEGISLCVISGDEKWHQISKGKTRDVRGGSLLLGGKLRMGTDNEAAAFSGSERRSPPPPPLRPRPAVPTLQQDDAGNILCSYFSNVLWPLEKVKGFRSPNWCAYECVAFF